MILVKRADGRIYWAVIRATRSGENTFITSFHRANRNDVRRMLRQGNVLLGEWKE